MPPLYRAALANTVLIKTMVVFCVKEETKMAVLIGIIGVSAAALLIYYVWILMKGDAQK